MSYCLLFTRLSSVQTISSTGDVEMAAQEVETQDDESAIRQKAHQWCEHCIGGVWTKVSATEMILERVSGGMSNYLYLCRLPDGMNPLRDEPHQVLLRIYGHATTSDTDVLVNNSVVFVLLAEKKLGPKPYGMFSDGRVEEFIVALPLKHVELSRPEIIQLVAERLAMFHSMDMPMCKKPLWMFSIIRRWISEINKNFSGHSMNGSPCDAGGESQAIQRLQAIDIEKEYNVLVSILSKVDSPVVFCHNDLHEGNILYNSSETDLQKKMTIIDWEFGNYNYRGFDFGNHFCEWTIGYDDESFTIEPDRYPSRQQQYTFFRHYLKACGQQHVSTEDLRRMYAEANTFALASHFLLGTWSTMQGHCSGIKFNYWDYATSRFEQYFKLKEQLPDMLTEDR